MLGRTAREAAIERAPERTAGRTADRGERRVTAWIGASIVIKGDVVSSEDTTLAGRVEGNVDCREHALSIAPGAKIQGDVRARAVSLDGEVNGTVTAEHSISIGATGVVTGDIVAPRMSIAEGATLSGRVVIGQSGAQRG